MKKTFTMLLFLFSFVYSQSQTSKDYFKSASNKEKSKDYQGAIADYTKAIEIDPNNFGAYVNRASIKERQEDYKGAITDYSRIINIFPNNEHISLFYEMRGRAKLKLEDYRGAIVDFDHVLEILPYNRDVYFFRGLAKGYLGQKDSGCLDLSKAGELGHERAYEAIKELCN